MSAVEMKDSGVEWLGEIPAHWQLLQLSALAEINAGQSPPSSTYNDEGLGLPFFQGKAEFGERYPIAVNWCSEPQSTSQPGDILVSVRAPVGDVNITPFECCIGRGLAAIKVNGHSLNLFIYNVLIHARQYLAAQGTGSTFESINKTTLRTIPIPLPPLAEQRAIAAYLDRETAQIDALIARTQQLNALLREKRVALISHAVTRGLDPAAERKDSGVEWLGEIPRHWDVKRIRHVVQTSPKKSELRYTSGELEVSFLPMPAIGEQGALDLSEIKHVGDVYDGYTYFCDNDVIVAKITPCFENGKGAIARRLVNGIGFGTTELFVLRPGPDTHSDYIYYLTVSSRFRNIGTISMQGAAGQQRVTELFTKNYVLGFPPLPEQRAIAVYLDRETAQIDALIAKNDQLIALLREKRTSLISAAVTGKIDLRNEVPACP